MKIKLLWIITFSMIILTFVLWLRTDGLNLTYKKGSVIIAETPENEIFREGKKSQNKVKIFTGGKMAELSGAEGILYEMGEVVEVYSYSGKYYALAEQARDRMFRAVLFYLSALITAVLLFIAGSTMDWGNEEEEVWWKLRTLKDWENYRKKEDLSIDLYANHPNGYFWWKRDDKFVFGQGIAGKKKVLAEFKSEKKLVRHLYHYFSKDPEYRKKVVMVCYFKDRVDAVDNILKADKINTVREEKHDLNGDMIYYLYVYGKDRFSLPKEYRQTRYI